MLENKKGQRDGRIYSVLCWVKLENQDMFSQVCYFGYRKILNAYPFVYHTERVGWEVKHLEFTLIVEIKIQLYQTYNTNLNI